MRISDWSSDVCSSDLAPAHIDIDPGRGPRILGLEHRRAFGNRYIGHGAERDLLARRGQDRQCPQALQAVAQLARIAHADRIAGQPLDRLADHLAADRSEEHASELQSLMRISYAVF